MLWTWLNFGLEEHFPSIFFYYMILTGCYYSFSSSVFPFFLFLAFERDYPKLFSSTVSSQCSDNGMNTRWHNIHFPMIMINNKLLPNGAFFITTTTPIEITCKISHFYFFTPKEKVEGGRVNKVYNFHIDYILEKILWF